ncbi:MAG: nitrogenase component 1 [archaeon]|nr:nitrogenase component 1 [archaeon]
MINEADGFMGAITASQSVKGLKAMINGPGGCRSRAMNFLRETLIEYRGDDSCCCKSKYMSRVSMLPCTHLNADDIILGSGSKITDGIKSVISSTQSDVVLIDTLGASVQVVDREQAVQESGFADKVILSHDDLSDFSFAEGFDNTMMRIVAHYVKDKRSSEKLKVNILGYTQVDRSWDYGKMEIARILDYLGLEIVTFVGCDCTVQELKESASASLNILIHPEYSIQTAKWYEQELGIPYLVPSEGTPIGFDSIRSFIREISEKLGIDNALAMEAVDYEERKVFMIIQNYDKFANGLRGSSAAFCGLESDVVPIMKLVYEYFNVAPRSVVLRGENGSLAFGKALTYLSEINFAESLGKPVSPRNLSLYFTDGLTAEGYRDSNPSVNCIGIMFPYPDTVPFADRCLIGFSGTRNLLDQIMNGMKRFTCGQPTPADFR